ncbi:hypothetical protein CCUS01_10577 [Colletotrichum cuscutae]|uniref:Uncharacterized protein n=1 Tax=Colletotrichum cuscutae TaxID=1209917 RepID=A0AAI9XLQ3_9PEZI|nr:hypothetical protein CCUS01_10577 [Colletotrichum cuscutae]
MDRYRAKNSPPRVKPRSKLSTCALTAQCPLSPMQHAACSTTSSTTPSAERNNRGTWDGSRTRNITEHAKTCLLGNPLRPEIHSTAAPHDQATTPPVNYTCTDRVGTFLHTARSEGAREPVCAWPWAKALLAHERAPATIQD